MAVPIRVVGFQPTGDQGHQPGRVVGETLQGEHGAIAHIGHVQAVAVGLPDQFQADLFGPAVELLRGNQVTGHEVGGQRLELDHKALIKTREGGKLPKLVWALDNEPSANAYTRRWVREARALGFVCESAQIPQREGRKSDWNDLHQRWSFIQDETKRADQIATDLKQARHQGALLLAESAAEKALLMYDWNKRGEFHLGFGSRLYWFKLDMEKFNRAMSDIEDSENHDDQLLNQAQQREKALQQSGSVVEIANCYPQALYFQRNEVTDESWYYMRVDFPHDSESVKNTFTSGQLSAASEFKKRLLGMAAGAMFTGSGQQLDKLMKDQLFGIKTVSTIDYVGYSKEYACYVYGDIAIKDGTTYKVNSEDYFEFGKLRLKTLQKGVPIKLQREAKGFDEKWVQLLWTCFGAQGFVALVFFFGSLFCEQIRARYDLRGYIRVERISKNHAQMLSLLDGIRLVLKLSDPQVAATQRQIVRMAIERQASISSDHAAVAEFWEVYDYLESLSEDPVVDHSSDPTVIAINLNEFCERAAEHKQKLADVATLRDLLKESRSRKFLDSNKAVHSAVRAAFNSRNPCSQPRPTTVKCWTFKA